MNEAERVSTEDGRPYPIARVIAAARVRLGYRGIRTAVARHAAVLSGVAAVCAASRPFVWPLHDAEPWKAVARALVLALFGTSTALAVVIVRVWSTRPSMLASARRLDEALGLAEVVASGFAFERDGRDDEMATFAVERARRALDGVAIARALPPIPYERTRGEARWLAGAAVAAVLELAVGAIDGGVVERALHPVTEREATAAADLKRAAEVAANVANGPNDTKSPTNEELVDAARRASEAAKRGDRKRASEALEDMRKAARALEANDRDQARSLRSLRDELEAGSAGAKGEDAAGKEGSGRPGRPSASASEALAKLKKDLDAAGADKEAIRKMIERLERAESAARAAGEKARSKDSSKKDASGRDAKGGEDARASAWSRAAAALADAREAAARGDKEAARRAMERAEREISAMERASGDPGKAAAMARLGDDASELARSMHDAMSGDRSSGAKGRDGDPKSGTKDGDGSGTSTTASASKDKGDPSGAPGSGPGAGDRAPGPEQRRVKLGGDLQARTDVREGERAVSAIEGMGRGGDPRAYREIFPSYDTVVEDGLREDTVPAARRPTVRRYFSAIRPGGDEESRKRP
jgi:hypothetical protein